MAKGDNEQLQVAELPWLDNPDAPDIYVDGYQGAFIGSGITKLNLFTIVMNPDTGLAQRKAIGRLTMALPLFVGFHKAMGELIEQWKRDGLVREEQGDAAAKP